MNLSEEIQANLEEYADRHLSRLSVFLNYELSSSTLYLASFFYGFLLSIYFIAAAVFTPYMIYVLFLEKKYGWLLFLFLSVISPLILTYLINIDPLIKPILLMIPMGFFIFYCILLKFAVNDWLRDRRFKRMWEAEKMLKKKYEF